MRKLPQILTGMTIIMAILACNWPSQQGVNAALTAVALTLTAQAQQQQSGPAPAGPPPSVPTFTPVPSPTFTPTPPPTACFPMVTATTNANVRSGDSTLYDIIGYLPTGGTAPIAGRNAANTWWYIEFAGGHGWISQSVTVASCLPSVVAVVAPPPLPPTPTEVSGGGGPFAVIHVSYDLGTFNEGSYHDCPIVTAHIETNGEGDVQYHWTRSDGASAPVQTIHFNSAGTKNVQEKWYLGSVWAGGSPEWLGIYIDAPNHQGFGHINVNACSSP